VTVIDGQNCFVDATVPVGSNPRALCATLLGEVFCANTNSNSVTVIGYESLNVRKTLAVGAKPVAFAEVPGLYVLVVNSGSNSVSAIDPFNDTVVRTYPVGTSPVAAVCYAGGLDQRLVYVANSASNDVTVIDVILDSVVATIPVGGAPIALALDSFNGKVYCANQQSDDVSVIDCSTNSVIRTFPANYSPLAVLTTLYGRTYVANNGWSCVTVIGDSAAVGVEESFRSRTTSRKPQATVVRGALNLGVDSRQQSADRAELVDIAGRKVLELRTGANDVRPLAPGVYFVMSLFPSSSPSEEFGVRRRSSSVTKVVIAQ